MNIRHIALGVLVVLFFFGEQLLPFVNNVIPNVDSVVMVEEKPETSYLSATAPIAREITDKNDRVDLCLVNHEFSQRVEGYINKNITAQQLNDIYVDVSRQYFQSRLKGKYNGFVSKVNGLFVEIVGNENGPLTKDQLRQLNRYFLALSWNLENAS